MAINFSFDDDFEFFDRKETEFSTKEYIVFLIDGTRQMYENDSPFLQCLETYRNIVRQKCSRNKKDKMGVLVFGTKGNNCDVEHVTVLQEFSEVTIDTLKNVKTILKDGGEKYKEMASNEKYSLYDILKHSYELLLTSGSSLKTSNTILLCTCNDNPDADNPAERRRIQHLIATFKDTKTTLQVIGLSKLWNDDYYKDLQIISGTFNADEYRRIRLTDFEQFFLNPSKSLCKLPWKFGPNISVEVTLQNLVSSPTYPTKVKLEKGENEILEACPIMQEKKSEDKSLDSESLDLEENVGAEQHEGSIITTDNILYCKSYSGTDVCFKQNEVKIFKNMGLEPGIEILAFKKAVVDPLFYVRSPYFISYTSQSTYESKSFFRAFISQCYAKKVMAICKVVTKSTFALCAMIPSTTDGGFYMNKLPFTDNVRDLDKQLPHFVFNPENRCATNKKAINLFKELMDLSKIKLDINKFTNPKFEKCIAHIEALALDEKLGSLPPDSTLPPAISNEAKLITDELNRMFELNVEKAQNVSNSKAVGMRKKPKFDVEHMASKRALSSLTVADLRDYLLSVNQPTVGNKSVLIQRVYDYLNL